MRSNKGAVINLVIRKQMVYALPPLALLILIIIKSVNVPFWDQWELVPIIEHIKSGHFFWHDFWAQHNEHRLFFPQLLMVGLAFLTHWNVKTELLLSFLIACASFGLLTTITKHQFRNPQRFFLICISSVIWFSPVQVENWLWGWQIQWFMNVLGVIMVVFAIYKILKSKLSHIHLSVMITGAILAQFSLGNGTLIWPIIILTLIYLRIESIKIIIISVIGMATTLLYYFHYNSIDQASEVYSVHHPVTFLRYFFMYLGRPLSFYHKPATLFGALIFLIFSCSCIYLFKRNKQILRSAVPWIVLGLYAIGSAFITGLARLNFGINEAFSSRYTTISSLLLLSTLMIIALARTELNQLLAKNFYVVKIALVALVLLILSNWAWGIHSFNIHARQQKAIRTCTQLTKPTEACLGLTYPNPQVVKPRLQYLKTIHWGSY